MSVPNQTPYIIYNANGLTTVFPYEFYIINAGDIQVTINGAVVTSGYSVAGVGNVGGGDVTFLTPPSNGAVVMLERVVPTFRLTDYQDNGDLLADTVNKDFDRLWMAIQRSFIYLGLALRRPLLGGPFDAEGFRVSYLADPLNGQDAATKRYVDSKMLSNVLRVPEQEVGKLPVKALRANKVLAFNASGEPIVVLPGDGTASDVMIELAKPTGASLISASSGETVQEYLDNLSRNTLEYFMAKMASGESVKICCYGDSTTDGLATTNWTANPVDSNGQAIGNTDHNLTAPNAWPIKLQVLLRDMYQNNNIHVYNAGYSGQKLINGWAENNYDRAVINNPHYGVCDIVFIDFGLNDITESGSQIDQTINYTVRLIKKIQSYGSLPVLLTSGPTLRALGDGADKDKREVMFQINQAKKFISERYNIPIVDKSQGLTDWLEKNKYGIKWIDAQPDGLHFKDVGHRAQAAFIAAALYSGTICVNGGGKESIPYLDARANSPFGSNYMYKSHPTRFGINPYIPDSYVKNHAGETAMTLWVYVNTENVGCVYNAIQNERRASSECLPNIRLNNFIDNSVIYNYHPINSGFGRGIFSYADTPIHVNNLSCGLYKLQWILPSDSTLSNNDIYHGWFSFIDRWKPDLSHVNYRKIDMSICDLDRTGKSSGLSLYMPEPAIDGGNYFGVGHGGTKSSLTMSATISKGAGVVIMGGATGIQDSSPYTVESGITLYRRGDGGYNIINHTMDEQSQVGYSVIAESEETFYDGIHEIRVDITRGGELAAFEIFIGFESVSPIISITANYGDDFTIPFGGYFGGVFRRYEDPLITQGIVSINNVNIKEGLRSYI